MKKQDWLVILIIVVVLTPFFIPATGFFDGFKHLTDTHPYIMAFFKFAILATFGEMLALRIREGVYSKKGFGVLPRMIVWGFLGMAIYDEDDNKIRDLTKEEQLELIKQRKLAAER